MRHGNTHNQSATLADRQRSSVHDLRPFDLIDHLLDEGEGGAAVRMEGGSIDGLQMSVYSPLMSMVLYAHTVDIYRHISYAPSILFSVTAYKYIYVYMHAYI